MAIVEIINTKAEEFTVYEDGRIVRRTLTKAERKNVKPTKARVFDVYHKPPEPKPEGWVRVDFNIWGEEIDRDYENIRAWRAECYEIELKNAEEHKKQKQAWRRHVAEVKKECYRQEIQRKKEKMLAVKRKRQICRAAARAWLERTYG